MALEGHGHSVADIDGLATAIAAASNFASIGHTHSVSDIDGLAPVISAVTSGFASLGHTHSISDIASLSSILTGITSNSIEKDTVTASTIIANVGEFDTLYVNGDADFEVNNVDANAVTVNGTSVALEGHTHSVADISDFASAISLATSEFASASHTHVIGDIQSLTAKVSGLTSNKVSKANAEFTNLSADNADLTSISASSATFGDINVTGTASLSTTNVTASTLTAETGSFTSLTVGGNSVALEGHTHSQYAASDHNHNGVYASISHSHAISDVTDLSSILSGITSSSIEKDTVTADIGYFRLLSVSGSANFALNSVSANSMTVNGTSVALVGHAHSVADIDGLSTALSAYASASHSHAISDIADLESTLSAFASSGHTHGQLAGITSSTIDKDSGNFVTLSASTATFETMTVSGSATFDITNLVADAITVSDLNLTGTLSVSSTAISAMTVTDMSVTGTLTLNNKSIATEEYVLAQISAAIGQILASAY